jgi:hypothetical protein
MKNLAAMATEMTDADMQRNSWMTEEHRATYYKLNYSALKDLRSALLAGRLYYRVASVSKSGMSRTLEIAYIKQNRLVRVTDPYLLQLAGCSKNGRISGCGMDMVFHSQYTLFRNLCPKMRYQDKMPRYLEM